MRNRKCVAASFAVVLCLLPMRPGGSSPRGGAEAQSVQSGQWITLPFTMPINPIHVGLLRTGKVLIVAGSENDPNKHVESSSRAAVWDLQRGTFAVQDLAWDVF